MDDPHSPEKVQEAEMPENVVESYSKEATQADLLHQHALQEEQFHKDRYEWLQQTADEVASIADRSLNPDTNLQVLDYEQISQYFDSEHASGFEDKFTFFSTDLGTIRGSTIQELNLSSLKEKSGNTLEILQACPFWLDVLNPNTPDLLAMEKAFDIHPLTIEDIQSKNGREKCDVFPNYYFVVIKGYMDDDDYQGVVNPLRVSILFQYTDNSHSKIVLERIRKRHRFLNEVSPDSICYSLIDQIIDTFEPMVEYMEHDTESISELITVLKASDQADLLGRISRSQKRVMMVSRLMNYKPELIRQIITRMKATSEHILMYLEDIYDHTVRMKQDLHQFDQLLEQAHANYLAQVSIEISQLSNESNSLGTKLAILTALILPSHVLSGLWGVNVPVPGILRDSDPTYWMFFTIFMGICCFSGGTFYVLRKYFNS